MVLCENAEKHKNKKDFKTRATFSIKKLQRECMFDPRNPIFGPASPLETKSLYVIWPSRTPINISRAVGEKSVINVQKAYTVEILQ